MTSSNNNKFFVENIELVQESNKKEEIDFKCLSLSSSNINDLCSLPSLAQISTKSTSEISLSDSIRQEPNVENQLERKSFENMKIIWDCCTVFLSFLSLYITHHSICKEKYEHDTIRIICDTWFFLDIIVNLIFNRDYGWIQYMLSWFLIDSLALFPWELYLIKPIIEVKRRRHPIQKFLFKTREILNVTRKIRGNHIQIFKIIANETKSIGINGIGLLKITVKYAPKYALFLNNMHCVVAIRVIRQMNWIYRMFLNSFRIKRINIINEKLM